MMAPAMPVSVAGFESCFVWKLILTMINELRENFSISTPSFPYAYQGGIQVTYPNNASGNQYYTYCEYQNASDLS